MIYADSHFHTKLSPDAKGTLLDKAKVATENRVTRLCVTDHFECQNPWKWTKPMDMEREFNEQKAKNQTEASLYLGIELGEPNIDPQVAKEVISAANFDMVIASVHTLENGEGIHSIDYKGQNLSKDIGRYLDCVEWIAKNADFDTLAHINMTVRYAAMNGVALSMEPYYHRLYNIFKILVAREKALEINMSSLYSPLEAPLPTKDVLDLYKKAGGELLTVGSDAHLVEHAGRGVKEAYIYAKEAGFSKITVYEKRKAQFIYI